jgi:hypothetical protein
MKNEEKIVMCVINHSNGSFYARWMWRQEGCKRRTGTQHLLLER